MHQQAPNMVQAKIRTFLYLNFLCIHVLSPKATAANASANANTGRTHSFKLELIHRDSIRSPYYTANLTDEERFKKLDELSDARLQIFLPSSSLKNAELTAIRPPLVQFSGAFMIFLRIGTGESARDYVLVVDTGSHLTWTQCQPCVGGPCFAQYQDVFDPAKSPTYRNIPCDDPICKSLKMYQCVDDVCAYNGGYMDKSYFQGYLARETFGFMEAEGSENTQSVPNLLFGCTHASDMKYTNGMMAGILGLDGRKESFAVQLAEAGITNGLFSYCLLPGPIERKMKRAGYLRFGGDIPTGPAVQRTPLVIEEVSGHYYLKLFDLSVGGQRLNLDPEIFLSAGHEGIIIDSGSYRSRLITEAYEASKGVLTAHFAQYSLAPTARDGELCFPKTNGAEELYPSMTFHFDGADFDVAGIHMFYDNSWQEFCWNVKEHQTVSLIGDAIQADMRITYDVLQNVLSFAPENCAADE